MNSIATRVMPVWLEGHCTLTLHNYCLQIAKINALSLRIFGWRLLLLKRPFLYTVFVLCSSSLRRLFYWYVHNRIDVSISGIVWVYRGEHFAVFSLLLTCKKLCSITISGFLIPLLTSCSGYLRLSKYDVNSSSPSSLVLTSRSIVHIFLARL